MKKIFLALSLALMLSACSLDDIFGLLAKSEVEQSAGEQVEFSETVVETMSDEMNDVKQSFDESVRLVDVTDGSSFGTAYRDIYSGGSFNHSVLAVLPFPEGESFYEGWLVNPTTKKFISTGVMETTEDGRAFNLIYKSEDDYTGYSKVVITLEEVADENPEKHILEGDF